MRFLRWRCDACSALWGSTISTESHCPFCGAQEISPGSNRCSTSGRFLPANPVESSGTTEIAPASEDTDRGRGDKELALTQDRAYNEPRGDA